MRVPRTPLFVSAMSQPNPTPRQRPRVAVWADPASQALGALASGVVGGETVTVHPSAALAALTSGEADLVLVPSLTALREPPGVVLAPGVGLVGEATPTRVLAVGVPLDEVKTVAVDPRWAQEAVLAQLVLREHYGVRPAFVPVADDGDAAALVTAHGAALVAPEASGDAASGAALPASAARLDLAREWADLTLRPMVWGLLAGRRGGALTPETARALAEAAATAPDPTGDGLYQLSLTGLGYAGLEALADHLFYTGTLSGIPELPFIRAADDESQGAVGDA